MRSSVLLCLAVSTTVLAGSGAAPQVFSKQSYEDARTQAEASGKMFIVDATAVWCRPCHMMDQKTWVDDRVTEWIREHAIAVRVDVDRDAERAGALRIEAMPTVIVFKDGREFDRIVGYRSADELIPWLEGLPAGRRAIDALRQAAGNREAPGQKIDVQARYRLAKGLVNRGALDEATGEYVWLWQHMLEYAPAMYGVRLSFMVSDMQRLAGRHEPARQAFEKLRDEQRAAIDADHPDRSALIDWIHLNQVIGDNDDTMAWFDRNRRRADAAAYFEPVKNDLFDLLIERERWADAGAVCADPVAVLTTRIEIAKRGVPSQIDDVEMRRHMVEFLKESVRKDAALLYAACLAAGREDTARQVASLLLKEQDDAAARQELVKTALSAGQPRPGQRRWLEEAGALGEPQDALRDQLERALAGRD